jgi:hypothetical protein
VDFSYFPSLLGDWEGMQGEIAQLIRSFLVKQNLH